MEKTGQVKSNFEVSATDVDGEDIDTITRQLLFEGSPEGLHKLLEMLAKEKPQ